MRFRAVIAAAAVVGAAFSGFAAGLPVAVSDSLSSALAVFVGNAVDGTVRDFESRGLNVDREALGARLADYLVGRPVGFTPAEAAEYLARTFGSAAGKTAVDPVAEAAFVAAAAAEDGAVALPDGLVIATLEEGVGDVPTAADTVRLRYSGTFSDGTVFDAIGPDEEPVDFPVTDLTPGFSEGLQHMRAGGRYRLTMPASLGYGDEGIPGAIPPGAALRFDVELIEINPK